MKTYLQVSQIKLPLDYKEEDLYKQTAKKLKIKRNEIQDIEIKKKSLDARKKENIHYSFVLKVLVSPQFYDKIFHSKIKLSDVSTYVDNSYPLPKNVKAKLSKRPIVVGSGPAGLFCAYLLSMAGLRPLILERGKDVTKRAELVEKFWKTGILHEECNVQFGEGGAGTFSDGKLNTMVKDTSGRIRFMLETFVKFGADPKILTINKPHIGTDVLKEIMLRMREEIISFGGEYLFDTKLSDFFIENGRITGIKADADRFFDCETLVLAIGHSARDTFRLLYEKKFLMEKKPFAMGLRVEHPQDLINQDQYGSGFAKLPPADYKLTHKASNGRGVYSFCMCPGGYVVNASSESGGALVNGMSYSDRGSENANSAIVVTVHDGDFGADDVLSGIRYQRKLEEKVYGLGKGNIPVQLLGDFIENKKSTDFGKIKSVSKGNTVFSNLREILPDFMSEAIIEGMTAFGKKIKGFDGREVVLSGAETRTSAPLRVVRDSISMEASVHGVYPIGEGAGYAGGITSSAIDGLKAAEIIIKKYERKIG